MNLHLQTIPARQGLAWIRHGFTVLRKKPFAMISLWCTSMVVLMILPQLIPPLGLITVMLIPLMSLGFMLATHAVLQGQSPNAGVFVAPFKVTRERRRQQLILCLVHGVTMLLVMLLASTLVGDSLDHVADAMKQAGKDEDALRAALASPELFQAALIFFVLQTLLSVPFWHAPALVYWGGQGVAQALFSSTLALWRNRNAYLLSALGWFLVLMSGLFITAPLSLLLGPAALVLAPLIVSTAFYSSLYFGFVDCFLSGTPDKLTIQTDAKVD